MPIATNPTLISLDPLVSFNYFKSTKDPWKHDWVASQYKFFLLLKVNILIPMHLCIKWLSLCILVIEFIRGLIKNLSLCDFFLILSEQALFTVLTSLNFPDSEQLSYFFAYNAVRIKMIAAKMYTLQSFGFFDSLKNWKDMFRLDKIACWQVQMC